MRPVLIVIFLTVSTTAQALELKSEATRATLLELYTSEGCNSCPPADRWFSGLETHPRLWKDLVPVAFHVDYWNYLGWEDRFASPTYAKRQRSFKAQGAARAVYTPGVMALGQEWRAWRSPRSTIPASAERPGVLSATLEGQQLTARFESSTEDIKNPELHVAVLGFGLKTPVNAGENRGELLEHDFVVLGYLKAPGPGPWEVSLPNAPYAMQASRLALAAWISQPGRVQSLQAVGGWLPSDRPENTAGLSDASSEPRYAYPGLRVELEAE